MNTEIKCEIPVAGWIWLAAVTAPVRSRVKSIVKHPAMPNKYGEEMCYIAIRLDDDIMTSFDLPASLFGKMAYYAKYTFEELTYEN